MTVGRPLSDKAAGTRTTARAEDESPRCRRQPGCASIVTHAIMPTLSGGKKARPLTLGFERARTHDPRYLIRSVGRRAPKQGNFSEGELSMAFL
ncbi:hypothetical protein MRX96_044516 [Rhipicephalus microplus]